MATVGVDVIETAALGRCFQLGMLYDCRKDALIPGITLWDPEKLQQSIRTRPQINTDFQVTASDSIEDKSSLMNIDGSLKLSLLGGLVNVTGAARYLNDIKKSFRQRRLTLHYHSTCRFEELTMNHFAPENIINQDVFDNDTATHVVTAVLYGADACFLFDREVSADENKNTVEGEEKLVLEKLRLISGDVDASLKMDEAQKHAVGKYTCTFYGDFQLQSNPTSFEDALKVFTDLPKHLGEKKELAVPLRVWLYPLDKLPSRASKLQRDVGMDLIIAIESVFESLNTAGMRCSDLLKDSPALTFTAFHDKIQQMKQNCFKYKLKLMKRLGSLLPNIRGDLLNETTLDKLLQEHEDSPFRRSDLAEWLKERERESDVIKSVLRQLEDAGAQAEVDVDLILMDLEVDNLVCFTFTSLDWTDVLLLQQNAWLSPSAQGRNNEDRPDAKQKSWLNPEVLKTMRNNLKTFKNLIDSEDRKPARFIVSWREMENNPGSCVLLYESECDEAVCFIPPSQPVSPVTEEVTEEGVVVKVPPPCPATEELRLMYKPKHVSFWTSKPVMKDQHTVTLTNLRAGTKYEIKYAAVGKLYYTVYSDVSEVTTEGSNVTVIEVSSTGRGEVNRSSQNLKVLKNPAVPIIKKLKTSMIDPQSSAQSQSSVSSSQTFKLRLKEEFQYLDENPGERRFLSDVFIEQHITEDPDSHISDDRHIMRNDVFKGQHIRSVLLKGDPGTGKTVTVQKFILDWAEDKSNTDIDYIFPISFQKLNIIRETVKKCSFMEILQRCLENTEHLKLSDSERIMLIFDGLDEFKLPLDFKTAKKITDKHEPDSVSGLLVNLIMGNLLPNAQIWITSRPAAANQIPDRFIDRVTEIQGFDDQQKEEFFRKRISDQRMSDKVIYHIQKSPRIRSMCYLPDYCRIIAAIPEKMFSDFPKTLTQMYSRLLLAQTELIPERRDAVVALGRIAFHLLLNANALFCCEHLKKCGIRDEGALIRSAIIKKIEDQSKCVLLCFVDRRTQEFLAALYATEVLNGKNDLQLKDLSSVGLNYGEICFTHSHYCDYFSEVMRKALERQMDLFFCFCLGLTLDSSQKALKVLLKQRETSSSSSQQAVQKIKTMIMGSSPENTDRCSLLFDALKELDEQCLIQEIKTQLKSGLKPSPAQISALMNLEK
ncbi:uncharacterized protein LOC113111263 isoform X1 [Carassius auratus]|uniref:Uncharacterized protein LOC113111263 isoform X1 n=1 Tax=Carassius auratus TaxID=7957 RepID=A0A6P6QDN9_CARAU|nr:uncharacterized protein LOC113111263 isoform X1 [Carassius auratus]